MGETPLDALARHFFETMERLDPSEDFETAWADLPDKDQDFYRLCIRALGKRRDLFDRFAHDDVVARHAKDRE